MVTAAEAHQYYFRDFELNLEAHQLLLHGAPVHLERRPFDLLVLLVVNHGQLVTREEVIQRLWPAKAVIDFDTGLNTLVRKVRHALGDSSDKPVFVETVAGRGYRFVAQVTHDEPRHAREPKSFPRNRVRVAAVAILLAAVIAFGIWQAEPPRSERISIAVLPFENLTGNDELNYLAAGLAEETSTSISQIDLPDLVVIGGVSARALTDPALPMLQVGRENNVDFFVQSSLRLEKSIIRVTSRLIRVANGEQVWSASFDRELTNVLGLQRELSIAIAEQVRQRLSPDVAAVIDRRQTQNPVAYRLYLKGRYEWNRFSPTSIADALNYYQQAVAIDPRYALAWAGMAHALITSPVTAGAQRESIRPAAQDALRHALEFGPNLAEVQLALGSYYFFLDRNSDAAEEAARRSVALDPNSAMSHMFLGIVLSQRGSHAEARAMLRRARELDPLFPLMFANSANVALNAGNPLSALEFSTQAVAINPEFWVGYLHLGRTQLALGNLDAALEAFSNAQRFSERSAGSIVTYRAFTLAKLGREDEVRDILAELNSRSAYSHVPAFSLAVIHASLGEVDAAFEWLERACDADVGMLDLSRDERLESLRSDLRFGALTTRCGFIPGSSSRLSTSVPN